MGLLLLVWLLMSFGVRDDTDSFNGAEPTKFSLKVVFIRLIAESSDNKSLEGITTNVRVLIRLVMQWAFSQQLFALRCLFQLLAITHLEPALSWYVVILILVCIEHRKECSHTRDSGCPAFFRCMIRGRNPSQRRSRRKERK